VTFTAPAAETTFGFEATEAAWTGGGFWNRNGFSGLSNLAYPTFVSTFNHAQDVVGGSLPSPFAGSFSAWYGQPETGNYIGTQDVDEPGSGGMSTGPNSGSFVSPQFQVPDVAGVQLTLKTWWEIESVNPHNFDVMDIVVHPATGTDAVLRLNPTTDPADANRTAKPYTSGGFNTAPVWQDVAISLEAYRGQTVQLRLEFDTIDSQYNGFRGWIVDQVRIGAPPPVPIVTLQRAQPISRTGLVPADRMPPRAQPRQ